MLAGPSATLTDVSMSPFSILIPVYNEEPILRQSVGDLQAQLEPLASEYEIILCENGSRDATAEIARQMGEADGRIKSFSIGSPGNGNYGKALRLGIERAAHEYIFCFEIDFWKVEVITESFTLFPEFDLVVASKQLGASKDDRPLFRRIASRIYNLLLRGLFGFTGTETHGIKAFRKAPLMPVVAECVTERDVFPSELVMRAERHGISRKEIPIQIEEIRPQRVNLWKRVPNVLRNFVTLYQSLNRP